MNPNAGWHRHHPRRFAPPWQHKRRFLFMRFLWFIGAFALLFLMAMGGLAYLLTQLFGGDGQTAMLVWLAGCGLALTFPLLVVTLAMRSFRGYADPLARVMAAADAVAEGDLSVRVPESGPGEIGRLARSFNRMVTELQHSDELRRSLTADVAHELRTPLHILQGNLEGILDGVYAPAPEHINLLIDEIRQLSRLVEDLRTLSLAEAGQLDMVMGPVDVAELISDAATSFSGQAEAAGLSLRVDVKTGDQPLFVTGDADRLDQVLGNLLANALRHTRSGGRITLCAEAMPGGVRIQVSDDGAGISPEDLPHIFERYWHGNTESEEAGSGLGLAIARQLVQAHNGRISVESQPGQGATFTIELTQFTG